MLAKQPRAVYSADHEAFRETARRFFREQVEPNVRDWERARGFPRELFAQAARYGLLQAGVPVEYGGMGGDFLHHVIVHEEHGYTPAGPSIGVGIGTDGAGYLFLYAGTEEQKHEWLPRFASGDVVSEAAFTEPHSGSDMADVRTFARKDGSDYIVSGEKTWITNAQICTHFPTLVQIENPDGGYSQAILMVDAGSPGLQVSPRIETFRKSASMEGSVHYDEVRVPARNLVGMKEEGAMRDCVNLLVEQRLAQAARCLACAEQGFDLTLDYVKQRRAFGRTIFEFQNTQFVLAESYARLKMLRAYIDQSLRQIVEGQLTAAEASIAKVMASDTEFEVLDKFVQLHGGMGFADDMVISKLWANARLHRVALGTSEIHKVAIARSLA